MYRYFYAPIPGHWGKRIERVEEVYGARDWRQEAWSDLVMFTKIIIFLVLILWSEWVLIMPITAWSIIFLEWRYVETCWPYVQLTRHSNLRCTVNMTIASRPHRKRQQLQFQTIEELNCNKVQQSTTILLLYAAWVAVIAPTSKRTLDSPPAHPTANKSPALFELTQDLSQRWREPARILMQLELSLNTPKLQGKVSSAQQMNTPTIPSTTQVHNSIQHYAEHQKQRFGSW